MVLVELDQEACRISLVLGLNRGDVFFRRAIRGFSREHDGRAVGIVSAHVTAVMPARSLKAHPDIGLRLLEHMSEMQGRIGIGQCRRHQYVSRGGTHEARDPA